MKTRGVLPAVGERKRSAAPPHPEVSAKACCGAPKTARMPAPEMARVRTEGERCSGGGLRTGASSGLKGDRDILSSPLNAFRPSARAEDADASGNQPRGRRRRERPADLLRNTGRSHPPRRGHGGRSPRPVPHRQHPGQQLPDAASHGAVESHPPDCVPGAGRRESPGWGRIVRRRDSGKAPAPVATLPPREWCEAPGEIDWSLLGRDEEAMRSRVQQSI